MSNTLSLYTFRFIFGHFINWLLPVGEAVAAAAELKWVKLYKISCPEKGGGEGLKNEAQQIVTDFCFVFFFFLNINSGKYESISKKGNAVDISWTPGVVEIENYRRM